MIPPLHLHAISQSSPSTRQITLKVLHGKTESCAAIVLDTMLRSVLLFFVFCTSALIEAEAWVAMQSSIRPRGPSPSPLVTNSWDIHLDLAKDAYRKRHWGKVKQICSRVISVSLDSHSAAAVQDWTAVEQAHLRLALAEQQDKQVDAARRTFQVST